MEKSWIIHNICHALSKALYIHYFNQSSNEPDEKHIILIKQIMKMSTEKWSHLLGTIEPVINEAEFYVLLCWIPKPMVLPTNYTSPPNLSKPKEHGNSDSKQASSDILRSVLWQGRVFVSNCCCTKLLQTWWLKTMQVHCLIVVEVRILKRLPLG